MIADGKNLKSFLEKLKCRLDELPSSDSAFVKRMFHLILASELAQRGVVIPEQILETQDDVKLMDQIVHVAGKALLDGDSMKTPLVSAAAHISSLALEKLAVLLAERCMNQPKEPILKEDVYEVALRRSRDVCDERFQLLLQIAGAQEYIAVESLSNKPFLSHLEGISLLLYRLSFGNSLRAAYFGNPDLPLMYKRSLDLSIKINSLLIKYTIRKNNILSEKDQEYSFHEDDDYDFYHTKDSLTPLAHLIRITESKQNWSRKFELSLRIAQSYINISETKHESKDILAHIGSKLWDEIQNNFVQDYETKCKVEPSAMEYLNLAENSIEGITDDPMMLMLQKLLKARILLAKEECIVGSVAESRFVASRNRSGLGSESLVSLSEFKDAVYRQLLTETLSPDETYALLEVRFDNSSTEKAMTELRDELLISNFKINSSMHLASYQTLQNGIKRLVTKCQSISINSRRKKNKIVSSLDLSYWDSVIQFVKPVIEAYKVEVSSCVVHSLLRTTAEAVLTVAWMHTESKLCDLNIISLTLPILCHCFDKVVTEEAASNKNIPLADGKVVRTTKDLFSSDKLAIQTAIYAARCQMLLSQIGENSEMTVEDVDQITEICKYALNSMKHETQNKVVTQLNTAFGNQYLYLLVSWSGLFGQPWPCCNVSEARSIIQNAQINLNNADQIWGRFISSTDQQLLQISETDCECAMMGSMTFRALKISESILASISSEPSDFVADLFRTHVALNVATISLSECADDQNECLKISENIQQHIVLLQKNDYQKSSTLRFWRSPSALRSAVSQHISQCRQLVADAFVVASKFSEADKFLRQALDTSPNSFDVRFSYGCFFLRQLLHAGNDEDLDMIDIAKQAQIHLLKAAKLHMKQSGPFALLGLFYEHKGDINRAVGCFSKALALEPSHPVAGRGILRLKSYNQVSSICTAATASGVHQNGWAWKALGDEMSMVNDDDDEAVFCYQQALRCKDIENRKHHKLAVFFYPSSNHSHELSDTWSALGRCYRRLGKYTASLRAFQAAHESDRNNLSFLCMWAQVEMDLGLIDEAILKYQQVLDNCDYFSRLNASFGLASCLLLCARKDTEEGKFGRAFSNLVLAIDSISDVFDPSGESVNVFAVGKLLGDLYSFVSILPPSVFLTDPKTESVRETLLAKFEFIKLGEDAYKKILFQFESVDYASHDTLSEIKAMTWCDVGINKLLQIRVLQEFECEEYVLNHRKTGINKSSEYLKRLLDEATVCFKTAIQMKPLFPLAWSGLGCTFVSRDPLIAQHSFCRALQIDKSDYVSLENLALMYLENDRIRCSEEAVDSLTQVADTCMMWIIRGLLIERKSQDTLEHSIASDAYRAALKISRRKEALIGLALSCRWCTGTKSYNHDLFLSRLSDYSSRESYASMKMFIDTSGERNLVTALISAVMDSEEAFHASTQDLTPDFDSVSEISRIGKASLRYVSELIDGTISDKSHMDVSTSDMLLTEDLTDVVRFCLDTFDRLESRTVPIKVEKFASIGDARMKVLCNPDSADAWLEFCKELIKSTSEDCSGIIFKDTLNHVVIKTKNLMEKNVTDLQILHPTSSELNGTHLRITAKPIDASKVAEAYALSYWISDINGNTNRVDLQRSMLLDPTVSFARSII